MQKWQKRFPLIGSLANRIWPWILVLQIVMSAEIYGSGPGIPERPIGPPVCPANPFMLYSSISDHSREGGGASKGGQCPTSCEDGGLADPRGRAIRPFSTGDPVFLRQGAAYEVDGDLAMPGPEFGWHLERSYLSNGAGATSFGSKWNSNATEVFLVQSGSNIELNATASSKMVFVGSGSPISYASPDYTTLQLVHDSANKRFVVTDRLANIRFEFHDFTVTDLTHRGKLKEQSTLQWHEAGKAGIEFSYNAFGRISQITSPEGQDYNIEFTYAGTRVSKVEIKDGVGNVLQRAEYTYYQDVSSPSTDLGTTDDLVQVKISRRATGDTTTPTIVRYKQYRYHSGSLLKAVYEHDAIHRIMSKHSLSSPEAVMQNADSFGTPAIKDFSSRSFTYYAADTSTSAIATPFAVSENLNSLYGGSEVAEAGMVKTESIGGCGSCGSNTGLTKSYFYLQINQGTVLDQNEVVRLVVEDTQDSADAPKYRIVYGLNDTGQLLRKAFITSPTGSAQYWCESTKLATTGPKYRAGEIRMPSAHTLVSTAVNLRNFLDPFDSEGNSWVNDTNTLNASDGLIYVNEINSDGVTTGRLVKKGRTGTAYYISATDYGDGDGDGVGQDADYATLPIASYTYPTQTTNRASGVKTQYAYQFWDSDDRQIKKRTTTLPSIGSGQNGSGVATVQEEYYDTVGRLRWTVNGEGYIDYYSYHPVSGGLAYRAEDISPTTSDSDVTGGSAGNWESWTIGSANTNKPTRGGGLPSPINLTNKTYYDDQGRQTLSEDAGGRKHYTVYQNLRQIDFPHWDSTASRSQMPIQISSLNAGGQMAASISLRATFSNISTSGGAPTGFSSEPAQGDYVSWTRYAYDDVDGELEVTDRYHSIPSSGDGTLSANYYRTIVQQDSMGRRAYLIEVISGSVATDRREQVTQYLYDLRDRLIEVKRGVSGDSASGSHNMTDNYTTYPTLVTVSKSEYDSGGVGDGHVTKSMRYFGTGTNDYTGTKPKLTYRGHVRGSENFYMNGSTETAYGPYQVSDIDWNGRPTATASYIAAPSWSSVLTGDGYAAYAVGTATNRRALNRTYYDDLGRVYESRNYNVDQSTGAATKYVNSSHYYDRENRRVASISGALAGSETAYDGVGRAYQQREVLDLAAIKYSLGEYQYRAPKPHPVRASMTGGDDKVMSLSHSEYSGDLMTGSHSYEANHNDTTGASAGIDLSSNDDYVRQTVYYWHDAQGRETTMAGYGSGDTAAGAGNWKYATVPSRPGTAPTSSSQTTLVTLYSYNALTGDQELVTDPSGMQQKTVRDDLGRTIFSINNFDDFNETTEAGTGDATDKSRDQVTKFIYNGAGQVKELIALDANGDGNQSDNQSTKYLYEDTVSASLKTNEIYPDSSDTSSSGSDQVKFQYNVAGEMTQSTDQRGTVIQYTFTNERRLEIENVTTLGTNVDGHVRCKKRSYDSLARLEKYTSYANTGGTGTIRNELQYAYDGLMNVTQIYQSHEGAVNTSSTPKVSFGYDATLSGGGSGDVYQYGYRRNQVTYPDGRVVFYDFDTANAGDLFSRMSKVRRIRETNVSGTILSEYSYTGVGRPAIVDMPQPKVKLDHFQGTSGTYAGWDRFGRTRQQFWTGYGGTANVDRIYYDYDYASNRLYSDIDSAIYASNNRDQVYSYDSAHRLKTFDQGTLSGSTISGTPTEEQDWSLDGLGNWSNYVTKTSGTTDLNQNRTVNPVNEITNITESIGPAWATPGYDAAGSMTTIPQPGTPTAGYTATYDAWHRLVKLTSGATTIAEYEYDATKQRIVKTIAPGGSKEQRQFFYYNDNWQVLEIRVEEELRPGTGIQDPDPLAQYVWHPHYIDAILLRDYDSDTNGSSVRYYYTQDVNFNVLSILSSTGTVLERYGYTPYGEAEVLTASFTADPDGLSDSANDITFTGQRYDSESRLMLYRHRYYHPMLGTFCSRDPVGYRGSPWNLYEYVRGRALVAVDPSGRDLIIGPNTDEVPTVLPPLPPLADPDFLVSIFPEPKKTGGIFICHRYINDADIWGRCIELACGGSHTYIQFGQVAEDGTPCWGTTGCGLSGGGAHQLPSEELHFHPTFCRKVLIPDSRSEAEAEACIKGQATQFPYNPLLYNCGHWAHQALKNCSLEIGPVTNEHILF
jgi:RHS repeat-associated protein